MRRWLKRSSDGPPLVFFAVWLVYMAFPLYTLFQQPMEERLIGLAFLLVFAASYLIGQQVRELRFYMIVLQIALISVACFRYDPNFVYMSFYPSPLIGMLATLRQMLLAQGIMLLMHGLVFQYYSVHENAELVIQLLPAMLITLFMPFAIRTGRRSRELRSKLSVANEEIARLSKQEERQRISRDLHDTLGHTLSLITLKSELAEKLITRNPERAVQEVKDIQATSRAALKQVRELVLNMSAVTIQSEVEQAKQILAAAGIEFTLRGAVQAPAPSPIIDNIAGMCLREAVTNIVKHSKARSCFVERQERAESMVLVIADDGIGLEAEASEHKATSGLRGMRERLKLIEGQLQFQPREEGGLRVEMIIPKLAKSIAMENKEGRHP
ncbi:two-component system sensor histidine kinase DesK [Paenibacillus phyllosphaerae]|uniref:histidine kinase n=1 Tax=Paenibacillus phyllosphaerae TaxID=274593 RepID=A0A7W5B163_9BACL|nr:sensor histidine kinase [Paenibacillus phyllosphaerae]MBB3112224.1 two-component system sensor histidine kinase DesK [Paenibacillus phyllosphaerae]